MRFFRSAEFDAPEIAGAEGPCPAFLRGLARLGVRGLVANAVAEPAAALLDSLLFPVTISQPSADPEQSYVVSPRAAYGLYAREELRTLPVPWARPPLSALVAGVDLTLRRVRVDDLVTLNNWLVSTNLIPHWDGAGLARATEQLAELFPHSFIAFRSLNEVHHLPLLDKFRAAGWRLLPYRQVWLTAFDARQTSDLKSDLKRLARTPLVRAPASQFDDGDFAAAALLYEQLYLRKYSRLNPAFTPAFLRLGHESGLMRIQALREPEPDGASGKGRMLAVIGTTAAGGVAATPMIGYDLSAPRSLGLYRLLTAMAYEDMRERGVDRNGSSGVGGYKRLRGARPAIEYTAFYMRHLGWPRRSTMRALEALLRRVGVPLMRRFML
jgi:hypothetical protein